MLRNSNFKLRKPGAGAAMPSLEIAICSTAKMLQGLTEAAYQVIMAAKHEAMLLGHKYISTEHILLGLLEEPSGGLAAQVLESAGIDVKVIREQTEKLTGRVGRCKGSICKDLRFTHGANRVLQLSLEEAHRQGHASVERMDLLLGLLRGCDGVVTRLFEIQGVDVNKIQEQVNTYMARHREACPFQPNGLHAKDSGDNNQTPTLDMFGTDLTKLAQEGKLHPFLGREEQLKRMIQILCRRMKNNPCLVGEPGVGKTAIIEGLAQRIVTGPVPEKLKEKKVIKLDAAHLLYFTKCHPTPEERIMRLIKEIEQCGDVILFVKEVHIFFEATTNGARNSSYILKNALDRGVIQCIGATTVKEHRKHMENDATLKRICQTVEVLEPSVEETVEILKGLRRIYETHHKLQYTDEALVAAAKLSQQYLSGRFLPDKAIDLIDEAGSRVLLCRTQAKNKCHIITPEVTKFDIQHIVSSWTGIPVSDVSSEEGERLLKLEEMLHKCVIGQNEAITTISCAIRRARVGLGNPKRPIASFMFTGSTGVGKTELAKALARQYFGTEDALIRFDMSEYMEICTASKLIGAPPGYTGFDEGGQLTDAVRRRPHAVVLFDEIEKAHSDVFNLMLQILEDGRLTDGKGQTVDFKNTLIIMTSNVGNSIIVEHSSGIEQVIEKDESYDYIKNLVTEELKRHFRPEFLNRFDEIVVFKQLTKQEVKQIADLMVREVCQRLRAKDMQLSVTCRFRDQMVELGYSPCYGARPLRRIISKYLEDPLAEKMLTKEIVEGDSVVIDIGSEGSAVVFNQRNARKEDFSQSLVALNASPLACAIREREAEMSCNLMGKMLDLLRHRKSPSI